jgi:DNA polymerase-1
MKILALDIEHSYGAMRPYVSGFYMTCVGWYTNFDDSGCMFYHKGHKDGGHRIETLMETVQNMVDKADIVVAHNLKHDLTILRYYGISFEKVKLHCTMVTEYLLSGQNTRGRTFSLEAVAQQYDLEPKKDKVALYWADKIETKDIPAHILKEYCIHDCKLAYQIYEGQQHLIDDGGFRKIVDLQNEFTLSLSDMELNGFNFDVERADKIVQEQALLLAELEKEAEGTFGYPHLNLGSSNQLSALLYGGTLKRSWKEWVIKELKIRPESTYKEMTVSSVEDIDGVGFQPLPKTKLLDGTFKTDKDTISQLKAKTKEQKRVKALLAEYSNAKKVKETIKGKGTKGLVNKIGIDGKIHPNLNQTVTATGRLSSSNPNSQNMPRGSTSPIKKCIVPTFDGIMQVDLSQIEWRVAGELAQDKIMLKEINAGEDQHAKAVVELMEMKFKYKGHKESDENRKNAKFFNFRMIYGGTAYGFYMDNKMPDFPLKKWTRTVDNFYKKYYGLEQWQKDNVVFVEKNGYLRAPTGRMFVFNKVLRKGGLDVYNDRQVKNYPVQGIAGGDILPLMSCIIRRGLHAWGLESKLILTVHDSLVFDYKDTERDRLIRLLYSTVNAGRSYVQGYFEIPWVGKIEGEVEAGPDYGSLSFVPAP